MYQSFRYKLDLGKLLEDTFEFYKAHFGTMCLVGLLMIAIPLIFGGPASIVEFFLRRTTPAGALQLDAAPAALTAFLTLMGLYLLLRFLDTLAQWYVMLGAIRQSLFIVRGGTELQANMMFAPPMMFLKVVGLLLLIICIHFGIMLPWLLCFISFAAMNGFNQLGNLGNSPFLAVLLVANFLSFLVGMCCSIWVGMRLYLAPVFIADQNMGIIDAMKSAWRVSSGNFWMLLLGAIVLGICSCLGMILCCIGIFLTIPISCLGAALVYIQLTGQFHCRDYPPAHPGLEVEKEIG